MGRRVLVVEPNATQNETIAQQLAAGGYETVSALDATAVLRRLRQAAAEGRAFDVVLARYAAGDPAAYLPAQINSDAKLAHTRVIALTTMDQQGDPLRLSSLGFCGHLCKPIRNRELLGCVDRALGEAAPQLQQGAPRALARGAHEQRYTAHVLLAEDNPVNQKVAVRFLERVGCRVRVACNGTEAVKAYSEEPFDLILMDLQMPVMDGITATRRIRAIQGGERKTPIFALTANAMPGQETRCLEAGMDGFMTKPLHLNSLRATLDQLGLRRNVAGVPAQTAVPPPPEIARVPVDLARLHELTEGDPEFTRELASTFLRSGQQTLDEIRAAIAHSDHIALGRAAHKFKGASANIHAQLLCDLAQALELQSGPLEPEACRALLQRLTEEFHRATSFLIAQLPQDLANTG
jgi:CheY-like chemotaxis protein